MPNVRADKIQYNGFTLYTCVLSGQTLKKSCFVSRRSSSDSEGFNRDLIASRAREIARYLDTEHSSIPTNVVLSAQPSAGLKFANGKLSWKEDPSAFLVLDGQHRLFSMDYTDEDFPFTVAIYDGLTQQAEVRLFIDINTKQKGVPPALLLDIKQMAGTESSIEERLRLLFDYVGTAEGSPLRGLLSPAKTQPNMVSRVTFNTALMRPMQAGALAEMDSEDDRGRLVVNYLKASDRVLRQSGAKSSSLTRATILQAFFEVFNDVVTKTLASETSLREDALEKTLTPLTNLDFDSYGGGNRPSKTKLVTDMQRILTQAPRLTSAML